MRARAVRWAWSAPFVQFGRSRFGSCFNGAWPGMALHLFFVDFLWPDMDRGSMGFPLLYLDFLASSGSKFHEFSGFPPEFFGQKWIEIP